MLKRFFGPLPGLLALLVVVLAAFMFFPALAFAAEPVWMDTALSLILLHWDVFAGVAGLAVGAVSAPLGLLWKRRSGESRQLLETIADARADNQSFLDIAEKAGKRLAAKELKKLIARAGQ